MEDLIQLKHFSHGIPGSSLKHLFLQARKRKLVFMWFPSFKEKCHYYSIEKISNQDDECTANWPNVKPGCKEVDHQQRNQSPVAGQKPQTDPGSPVLARSVPHHRAVPDFLYELGVGQMIATKSANKIFPGAKHFHLISKPFVEH